MEWIYGVKAKRDVSRMLGSFLDAQEFEIDALGIQVNGYDLACLVYQLFASWKDSTSHSHFFIALYTALGSLYRKSYSEMLRIFAPQVAALFSMCYFRISSAVASVQSGAPEAFDAFLTGIRDFCADYNIAKESELGAKTCTFVSLLLTLPFAKEHKLGTKWLGFQPLHVKTMEKAASNMHSMTFLVNLLDCSQFVLRKMVAVCTADPKDSKRQILFGDAEFQDYSSRFRLVVHYMDRIELVSNQGWSYKDYLTEIEQLTKLNSELTQCATTKLLAANLKHDAALLQKCKFRVADKMKVTRERDPPWAFLLIAPPNVGKSAIMEKLFKLYADIAKSVGRSQLDYDPSQKYTHNFYSEYMSEFKMSTRYIVMDDIDQYKANILEQMKGGAVSQAIAWINPTPHVTNQAELHNKGMIPCLVDVVAGTANTHEAGLSDVFRKEGGIFRRFLFIEVSVREEFRKPGETALAGDKENPLNPELHYFFPRKYENINGVNNQKYWHKSTKTWEVTQGEPMTFSDLGYFLRETILLPFFAQTKVAQESNDHFLNSPLCDVCGITSAICRCATTQSGDDTESFHDDDDLSTQDDDEPYQYFVDEDKEEPYWFYALFNHTFLNLVCFWFCSIEKTAAYLGMEPVAAAASFSLFSVIVVAHDVADFCGNALERRRHSWYRYARKVYGRYFDKSDATGYAYRVEVKERRDLLNLAAVFAFLSFVAGSAWMFSSCKKDDDEERPGTQAGKGSEYGAAKNTWATSYEDMSRLTGAPSTTTMEQLRKAVHGNIVLFAVRNEETKSTLYVNGLGLHSDVCAIPKHYYRQIKHLLPIKADLIRSSRNDVCGPNRYGITIDESCFHFDDKWDDMALFSHYALGPLRDIRKFLFAGEFRGVAKGVFLYRDLNGCVMENAHSGFQHHFLQYHDPDTKHMYQYKGFKTTLDYTPHVGQCGGPYLIKTLNGVFIGGFHVAAMHGERANVGFCFPLRGDRDYVLRRFTPLSYNGIDLNETYVTDQDLAVTQSLDPKCPSRMLEGGAMNVYGKLNLPRRKLKSDVVPTMMSEEILEHYGKLDFTHFSPRDVNSRLAAKQNLEGMVSKPDFQPAMVADVEDHVYNMFSRTIRELGIELESCAYDLDVGVNGLDKVPYVDRLKVKTSGGFAHRGRKDKYFVEMPSTEEHELCHGLDDTILKEVDVLKQRALRGERMAVVWDMNFKDEPISESKVMKDKCRIFNSAPLAFSVLMRSYFLWCVPLFLGRFRHRFGMATGANAVGDDWTVLYNHVIRFGKDRIIAGDYSSFDKRMPANLLMSAFSVLIRISIDAGFPKEDLLMMKAIATETSYPITNVFGSLIGFFGSNPSGHPLTTIINCIVNIMYMMIAVKEIERETGESKVDYDHFFDSFSLLTYGDDNIGSSRLDYINHTAISKALARFGVGYTMADKESESRPFINIEEADFLKRRFVPDVYRPGVVQAPLAESSILKSLSICTKSRSILFEQQCAEIIDSACREYFQYGKKIFMDKRRFLRSLAVKYNLLPYMATGDLPTFETLYFTRFGATVQSGNPDCSHRFGYYSLLSYGTSSGEFSSDKENDDPNDWSSFEDEIGYLSCGCIIIGGLTIHRELTCNECHCDQLECDFDTCGGLLCINHEHNDYLLSFDEV